jgi:hypothetical protein
MSLQSVAHPDIAKVHSMLSKMDGPQLQQFAAAHQDNAIYVSLAMQVDKDRKEEMQRLQALMTGHEQPKVIPQAVASLSPQSMIPPGMGGQGGAPMPPPGGPQGPMPPQGMPPAAPPGMQMPPAAPPVPQAPPSGPSAAQPGIAALPAPNMQGMADGGIAGYADGNEAVGYAEGGAIRMADGTPPSMLRDPGYNPYEYRPTISQIYGDQPTMGTAADAIEEATRKNAVKGLFEQPGMQQFVADLGAGRIRPSAEAPGKVLPMTPGQGALNVPTAAQLTGAIKGAQGQAPYKPTGIETLKAPAVPTLATPTLERTTYEVGEQPTVAAIKGQVGQLVDSSDLMAKIEGAQADLRRQGKEAMDFYEKNKPTKNLFSETVARLDKEEALGANKKEQAQAMALMMAGFKMMESPYGGKGLGAVLRNIGAGAKVGAENYSSAVEKLEAAAERRNQQRTTIEAARDAAERGDFATKMNLMQHGQQLDAQANALGVSAAQDLFKTNASTGTSLWTAAQAQHEARKNVAATLGSEERRAQFSAEAADRRAMFGAKMEMLKTQYEQAGANARAMAPTAEMRMAMALGGGNLEAGLRRAAEISAGKTDMGKLYVQSKAEFDAKNMNPQKQFMSPQEFMSLYNTVSSFRSAPAPLGTPTGKVFQ